MVYRRLVRRWVSFVSTCLLIHSAGGRTRSGILHAVPIVGGGHRAGASLEQEGQGVPTTGRLRCKRATLWGGVGASGKGAVSAAVRGGWRGRRHQAGRREARPSGHATDHVLQLAVEPFCNNLAVEPATESCLPCSRPRLIARQTKGGRYLRACRAILQPACHHQPARPRAPVLGHVHGSGRDLFCERRCIRCVHPTLLYNSVCTKCGHACACGPKANI